MLSDAFCFKKNSLFVEDVPLIKVAEKFGTPTYVYSQQALTEAYQSFDGVFSDINHQVFFAVKANSNLSILNLLGNLGSGFDIVSGGELARVLKAGADPQKIVFSGVGKTSTELKTALEIGICCFNIESEAELLRLSQIAQAIQKTASISLRVNPDIDPQTHPYISTGLNTSKFGISVDTAIHLYEQAIRLPFIQISGIDCHIGSQITAITPFVDAVTRILSLVDILKTKGIVLSHIDIGGGMGIRYRDESPPSFQEYATAIKSKLANYQLKLFLEPGRALVGNAGLLLTQVEYVKKSATKKFAIVDAAMNDLMRPALYDAYHDIIPVEKNQIPHETYDVVGPVCESGDCLAKSRHLAITQRDLLAILSAGAYGMSMSSNYNTRPRAAEVLINGDKMIEIARRQTIDELWQCEEQAFSDFLSK